MTCRMPDHFCEDDQTHEVCTQQEESYSVSSTVSDLRGVVRNTDDTAAATY